MVSLTKLKEILPIFKPNYLIPASVWGLGLEVRNEQNHDRCIVLKKLLQVMIGWHKLVLENIPWYRRLGWMKSVMKDWKCFSHKLISSQSWDKMWSMRDLPGICRGLMTGQKLAMKVNTIIVIKEPKNLDSEFLISSVGIISVNHSCISSASVE